MSVHYANLFFNPLCTTRYCVKFFVVKPGQNTIFRESSQSSVTIPFERTYRDQDERPTDPEALAQFNFCGCGWPENMLIPKGKPEGMPCQLFVMMTNFDDDKVSIKYERVIINDSIFG